MGLLIIRLLYDDVKATALRNRQAAKPFKVRAGVKEGYVIRPTLFWAFLTSEPNVTMKKLLGGVLLVYGMEGSLLGRARLRADSESTPTVVVKRQYADDRVMCAVSEVGVNVFTDVYETICLTVNMGKPNCSISTTQRPLHFSNHKHSREMPLNRRPLLIPRKSSLKQGKY